MRGADVAIVVYDVTSKDSSDTVSYWLEELRQSGEDLVIAVVGNKADAVGEREVSADQGRLIAESCGNALFQETSARTGEGVETIFVKAAQAGWEKKKLKDLRKAGVSVNGPDGQGGKEASKCGC
jgi:Ras-related protein Rab-5C